MFWGLKHLSGSWLQDETGRLIHYPSADIAKAHLYQLPPGWDVTQFPE